MHLESIEPNTRTVLEKIAGQEFVKPFFLAGGTALALHLGHRLSVDLDFFTPTIFSVSAVRDELKKLGDFEITSESEDGTLNGILDEVSVSFFIYPYGTMYPLVPLNGVFLADERDIAAMKIDAISRRGSKKDFVDLYFLLEKYTLPDIINFFEQKFSDVKYNKLHPLKSLLYFTDAEEDTMPILLKEATWEKMKGRIISEVKRLKIWDESETRF